MGTYKDIRTRFKMAMNEKMVPVNIGKEKIGEIDDSDILTYKKTVSNIKSTVNSMGLEKFLEEYLTKKKLTGSELQFAINNIIRAYRGQKFNIDNMIETLSEQQVSILSIINSKNFVKDLSDVYNIPTDFIEELFRISGKPGSASIGAGEFMLLLLTDLLSAPSKDLMDQNGSIYEVKENGKSNNGFRVGSQGKSASAAINILNQAHPSFNYQTQLPLNVSTTGKGIPVADILQQAYKGEQDLDYKKFTQAFLTFEKTYQKNIDKTTQRIIQANDVNMFRSYLANLQVWGYMKAEGIENIITFSQSRGRPTGIGILQWDSNFNKFFKANTDKLQAGGWENDGRNMSFRIKFI